MIKKGLLFTVAFCLIINGCAYFNTFYNAKTAFSKAMKVKEQSRDKTAPADMMDKVIEKCGKVIKYYPNSKWVDDAIILMGKAYIEQGKYDRALRKFDEIIIYYPHSPFMGEALYLTGITYLKKEDYNLAIGTFNKILNLKESKYKDASAYRIIETYSKKQEFEQLVQSANNFISNYKNSSYLSSVYLLLGDAHLEKENLPEAVAALKSAQKTTKSGEEKNIIEEKYAVALIKKGNMDEGLSILKNLREKSQDEERTAHLTFEICKAYLADNQTEKALKELDGFISIFPRGANTAESFYRKGLIYEEETNDIQAAIESYDKALQLNPEEDIKKNAAERGSILKMIKGYREKVEEPDSTTNIAKLHLLLAELFLFEKHNPDTALKEYKNVLDSFPDSPFAPKAALATAWIYEKEKYDTVEAMDMYKKVEQNFPQTIYYYTAVRAIGRLKKGVEDRK
jgi:tetratricopeptide (TPR) repeat protein